MRVIEIKELHRDIFKDGELVYNIPHIDEIREYCMSNLKMLKNSQRTIKQPEKYKVELTKQCFENKMKNIEKAKLRINQ